MLRKIRERIQSEESGFTLIELLVVILIIGILAAIAIPAFLGQREKAQDSEAKSAVRTAASAAKAFYTDNQTYVGMDVAALKKIEPSLGQGQGTTLAPSGQTATGYTLTVTSKANGGANKYTITEAAGIANRTCVVAGEAGCPSSGSW
jgi:type IV pilus assembly protein PilA